MVRRYPLAMLPFSGYDMVQYCKHWLDMQALIESPPKIFQVNWFRKNKEGKFLWPGYGENMRVLKWIVSRAHVKMSGQETVLGWIPKAEDFDLSDLDLSAETVNEATSVDETGLEGRARITGRVLSRSSSRRFRARSSSSGSCCWPG